MPLPSLIAIDGPVAVGKSTVGSILARRLGYRFVDTGIMYRALTWLALNFKVSSEDEAALSRLARESRIDLIPSPTGERVLVNSQEITAELRDPEVEAQVSQVSQVVGVREALVVQQRRLAEPGGVVMAGRDIGTVVLPQAELKVFLSASPEERARRRHQEQKGASYETILAELKRRDEIDTRRAISPLRPAPDARIVDTEGLTAEQVVAQILKMIEEN
jgi:cytidylate kinase